MVGALECQELLQRLLMRLDTQTEKDSSMHEDQPFGTKGDEAQVANDKNEEVGVNGC